MSKPLVVGVSKPYVAPSEQDIAKMTLEEQSAALGVAMNCTGCGRPATVKITMYAEAQEFIRRSPEVAAILMVRHDGELPVMNTKKGPMVPFSVVGACPLCRKELEIAAARAPSWCWADIYEPKVDALQLAVSDNLH